VFAVVGVAVVWVFRSVFLLFLFFLWTERSDANFFFQFSTVFPSIFRQQKTSCEAGLEDYI
jgi:hypothetical protein